MTYSPGLFLHVEPELFRTVWAFVGVFAISYAVRLLRLLPGAV